MEKAMKFAISPLLIISACGASNVKYVDPMIGTDPVFPSNGNYAGMIPTVGSPFAMTRWTAFTFENYVGTCPYHYTEDSFHGFLATHQPAQWMGESGEMAVAPGVGDVKTAFKDRGLKFSHDDEVSTPQYYKTILATSSETIVAELAATSRAGVMRFTFSEKDSPYVVVQATRTSISGEVTVDPEGREIYGWNPERQDDVLGPFTADDFKGYFVARFDTEFASWGTANNSTLFENSLSGQGEEVSAYVRFAVGSPVVNVRVGVSYISIEQARVNLDMEIGQGSVEEVAANVEKQWAEKLDLVELTNASEDDLVIFYTAMYHALQYPSEMSEKNATGEFYYSGYDNTVHEGTSYTGYSIWDTFRSEWAFINLFAPERIDGMIQSMLQSYKEGGKEGRLPMWLNIVETNIMIGTHSSSLIAESMAKGFKGFDMELMWEAIYKDAMIPPDDDLTTMYYDREEGTGCEARAGLTRELELGYVAAIQTSEAGSRTLEYAYDDYTVSVIASILGKDDEAKYFLERSKNYQNIWNKDTLFMEARYENGTWCTNPSTWTEADNWVYTFNVQHDFAGLRDLFGGADALGKKLDEYYLGGHNDQTNEPSHATVYAYFFANQPAKAQSTIRSLLAENYFNSPVGLSGNDDCGQMSSWYVLNALGMYPMNPASAEYVVSTPLFDEASVKFPQSNAKLTIKAKGAQSNPYVAGVTVDGVAISKPIFTHQMLLSAKEIVFDMSSDPQTWGANQL